MAVKRDTILSSVGNQSVYRMALEVGGEFRVMVRSDDAVGDRDKYSGAVASAKKLKKPRKYPSGFAFAVRVRPRLPIEIQGEKSDV